MDKQQQSWVDSAVSKLQCAQCESNSSKCAITSEPRKSTFGKWL